MESNFLETFLLLPRPVSNRGMGSSRSEKFTVLMQAIGGAVCALALAVLVGWHLHIRSLIQISPTLAPMQRMTAIGFLLSGAALLFLSTGRRPAAAVCSAIVILQACLVCAEYALKADYGIDQLLGPDYIRVQTSNPGRMSPVTALCFLAVGVALLAAANRKWVRFAWAIVGIAAAMLMAVGGVSVLGYLVGHPETYGWSHLTRIAMHTAAAFALLGAGLLAWAWKESREKYGPPAWLPLSIGMGMATAAFGAWQALMLRPANELPLISGVILAGGIAAAFLIALAVFQSQQARRYSRELQEDKLLLEQLFEASPDTLILTDQQGCITQANKRVADTFGYAHDELIGQSIEILVPEKLRNLHRLHREGYYAQPAMRSMGEGLELNARRKDGSEFPVEIALSPVQVSGEKHVLAVVRDITERKQAEQERADQAALLGLAHDAIFVRALDARITFWNRGAEETYGWPAREALGRSSHELLQTRFPIPLPEIETLVLTEGQWEGELEHTIRDGNSLIVASRWSLQRDAYGRPRAVLEINRDISARRHAEEQLHNLTARLSLAIRSASIGVWDWDLRSNTTVWDDTIFAMFAIPQVVPMAYEEFVRRVHPDDLAKVQASLERAIQGKTQDFVEFRIIRPDGSVRHIYSAEGVVLDERGNVIRVVGTAVDITERKQMEAQIEANKMQLVASARLSALGMMAGGVAHEINNPLGIIHALASDLIDLIAEKGSVPPEVIKRDSVRIRDTADRIARIVKSLRLISREGPQDKLYSTSAAKIITETLEICQERFRANGVKLLVPQAIPELNVSCREVQIEQILLNLLQNAFDAVVDQPEERWIRLDVSPVNGNATFSVTDSGAGIPAELQPHIMEPFFTTKPVGKGTGLGLSLSKTIAEEHGGRLEYSKEQGHTRFSLILPLAREAEAAWT